MFTNYKTYDPVSLFTRTLVASNSAVERMPSDQAVEGLNPVGAGFYSLLLCNAS